MRIVGVLCIRNEEAYLANCLRHLVRNGIEFVIIDHASSDGSSTIYRRQEFAAHLVAVHDLEHRGVFALADQLSMKMKVAEELDADWIIHLDADEVMHSYRAGESLCEAIERLGREGATAINFDEFVFLPVERTYLSDADGWQPISHYYFFEPTSPRLMRAWRRSSALSMLDAGGHVLVGDGLVLAPEHLALRHYVVRDQDHAFRKYVERTFAPEEVARGWHRARIGSPREAYRLPPASRLKRLSDPGDHGLDRSEPWARHFWMLHDRDRPATG